MIKTFKYEHKDGLDNRLQQNSVATASSIEKILAFANPNQEDLFYIESVLASVGWSDGVSSGWNENTDVFGKVESFNARNTPVDKQFNLGHNEKDIIGHITSSKIISNGTIIPDTIDITELPDEYDIIVGSVLYKHWSDKDLQDRMHQIIAEIQEGKWFVSMECMFAGFDYALIDPTGKQQSLARNDQTSFLTKHLRAYGGQGEYQGYKVGRLLKNFTFSGKGLVTDPANKRSVIFNFSDTSDIETDFKVAASKEKTMSEQDKTIQMLEDRLALAEKAAKEVADKAVANQIAQFEADKAKLQSQLESVQSELKGVNDKLTVANEVKANKETELETVTTELAEVQAELDKNKAELGKIEAEKAQASRLVMFSDRNIDEAKARNLVDKCQNMTDETFQILVDSFAKKDEKKDDKKVDDKKVDDKAKADEKQDEILDELEAIGAALTVADDKPAEIEQTRAAATSWLSSLYNTKKEK